MMNNVSKQLLLSLLILIICSNVNAQLNWNFTTAASSSGVISNITASSLSQVNNNSTTTFIDNGSPASGSYSGASGGNNGNLSAKIGAVNTATSTYIQLVLTPASGYSVSLTGLSWGNYSVSSSGPSNASVYTSIDNYLAPLSSNSLLQNSSWTLISPVFSPVTHNRDQPLTIRIYASGGSGSVPAAGTANWRIDDLKVTAKALPIIETVFMSMKYATSPPAAAPWNNVTGLTTNNLNNSNQVMTSVGLDFLSGSWNNTGDQGRMTGNNSGVYPDNVIRDYYWCGAYGAPDSMLANIKGLDTSAKYNVTLFGSSKWNGVSNNGTTVYSINGVSKPLYVDSNYLNTVSFNNIKPNNSGIIQFKFKKGDFAPYALVNAVVLEKLYDSASLPVASWVYGGNTVGAVQKIGTADSLDLPIITNNVERVKITANGKIGVGTTNPDSTMHIVGGLKFVNGTQGMGRVLTSDSTGGASWQIPSGGSSDSSSNSRWGMMGNTAGSSNYIGTNNAQPFAFRAFGEPAGGMLGNENTGLGIRVFKSRTTFTDNTAVGAYALDSATTGGNNTAIGSQAGWHLTTGTHNALIGRFSGNWISSGNYNTALGSWSYLHNPTGQYNTAVGYGAVSSYFTGSSAYASGSNNTGIGTRSLHRLTTGRNNVGVGIGSGNNILTGGYNIALGDSSLFNTVAQSYNIGLGSRTSATGNYGIALGTDAIASEKTLAISDSIKYLQLKLLNYGVGQVLTSDASGNATWQPATTGTSQWTTAGSLTYLNNTSGRVAIGITAVTDTNYRLFVEKGIRTRKVKVDVNNWPDYVFNPQYELRSIVEIERYIKDNGHLPDLPSAAEAEKDGISLGDNQALLLKKIEELTLYMIELNKKVAALEEQNNTLKKIINKK